MTSLQIDPQVFENFFTDEEVTIIDQACQRVGVDTEITDPDGVWAGQLREQFKVLTHFEVPEIYNLLGKIRKVIDREVIWSKVIYTNLYRPWDVHTDWYGLADQSLPFNPYCIMLIPLEDIKARTIFFEEKANYKDFYKYKESNPKSKNPVPKEFWDENLDFCWPTDREYLTLNKVMPWQNRGQLFIFPRNVFHSSDNFHKRNNGKPKRFLQVVADSYV